MRIGTEMDEAIVKKTQDTLGKIIGKKPPLTEKLLNRPPFRFLHDVLTSVIKQTGFMKGLFTEKEMNPEAISSKEEKISFLQKAIDITVLVTGAKLSVRPSKIVAGLEAEKTNEFLQVLADAISKKPDNDTYVKKVLSGEISTDGDSTSKVKENKSKDADRDKSADRRKREADKNENRKLVNKPSSKDKENREKSDRKDRIREDRKERDDRRDKDERHKDREERRDKEKDDKNEKDKEERRDKDRDERRDKEREARRDKDREERKDKDREGRTHDREKSRNRDASKDGTQKDSAHQRESSRDGRHRNQSPDADKEQSKDSRKEKSSRQKVAESKDETPAQVNGLKDDGPVQSSNQRKGETENAEDVSQETDEEPQANRIPRPSSAKGSRRRHREDDDGKTKILQNDETDASTAQPQPTEQRRLVRPSSARPAPPKLKKQEAVQDTLIERVDSGRPQRVENVIEDNAHHSDDDDNFVVEEGNQEVFPDRVDITSNTNEDDGQHGGLVKKILETKKEYDKTDQQNQHSKTKIDKSAVNDLTKQKERELIKKEVEKLRTSIQNLTRSVNPLGKIMDYVQEDLHSMQKERAMWKTENKKLADQIKQENSITESSVEPLKVTLAELEQAVADQLDLIASLKHNIYNNDEKIAKMLTSVAKT